MSRHCSHPQEPKDDLHPLYEKENVEDYMERDEDGTNF